MSNRKRILVVEDDDASRQALVRMLQLKNYEVTAYNNCGDAAGHLEARDFDIALLDVRMPGRCGDDFGKELRERSPGTMIVFLTGEAKIEPLKAKVADCFVLRKPVDADVLMELLECFCTEEKYAARLKAETARRAGPGHIWEKLG